MHVAEGVDVHHERHRGDNDEHHHRDGVEHYAHIEAETLHKERQPLKVVGREGSEHPVGRTRSLEKVLECSVISQHGYNT